jgi:hypothetical protein
VPDYVLLFAAGQLFPPPHDQAHPCALQLLFGLLPAAQSKPQGTSRRAMPCNGQELLEARVGLLKGLLRGGA